MAILNNNPLVGASGNQGGYNINNSLRFRSSASAYLTRTFAGSPTTFTVSMWVKRGALGTRQELVAARGSGGTAAYFEFNSSDQLNVTLSNVSGNAGSITTTAVYRDPSAWYHIMLTSASGGTTYIYVNGTQVGSASASSGYFLVTNTANYTNTIGQYGDYNGFYLDGYMADVYFIDGSAKTPSDFGETDTTTGVWKPKVYSGTYGTNGFYLKFSDIATTSGSNAGLGKDFSGNTNYWTTNNISVTSGTTYDAMTDVPTNTSATVANYAVLNPLAGSTLPSITEANLKVTGSGGGNFESSYSTIGMTTGKWYAEFTWLSSGNNCSQIGVGSYVYPRDSSNQNGFINGITQVNLDNSTATNRAISENGTLLTGGDASFSFSVNDIIGIAFDADAKTVNFYKNNAILGSTYPYDVASVGDGIFYFITFTRTNTGTSSFAANFGQRPFTYTPPTGFKALNTFNLPTSTILQGNKYMDATIWTGNGNTSRTITNAASFKPDFVWLKERDIAIDHILYDSIRGPSTSSASKALCSNTTVAEGSQNDNSTYGYLDGFTSSGFTVTRGSDGATSYTNKNNGTYVGWQWQAGQGSTSSNTSGSITSTVSVNTTAGFSIQTWTGTGANATVGHGLGVAPKMIIIKNRTSSWDWGVYHASLGATKYIYLNQTAAAGTSIQAFNNTEPTSSVFSVGTGLNFNNTATMVSYCWAEIAGFSKFGSYTGNGSTDGPMIYCNFTPKFILIKRTDTSGTSWVMYDSARATYNVVDKLLLSDSSGAEVTATSLDFLSNGFKLRSTDGSRNASGGTYIYACFASNPFRNSNAY